MENRTLIREVAVGFGGHTSRNASESLETIE